MYSTFKEISFCIHTLYCLWALMRFHYPKHGSSTLFEQNIGRGRESFWSWVRIPTMDIAANTNTNTNNGGLKWWFGLVWCIRLLSALVIGHVAGSLYFGFCPLFLVVYDTLSSKQQFFGFKLQLVRMIYYFFAIVINMKFPREIGFIENTTRVCRARAFCVNFLTSF